MRLFTVLVSFASIATALIVPPRDVDSEQGRKRSTTSSKAVPSRTTTSASTATNSNPRASWLPGYDLNTNYYDKWPNTGVTREYFFEITNTTSAPDGRNRIVLLVNGQLPGPTIEANWGDMVKVHVTNKMEDNGTSIHFHGIRQLNTNQNDGVTSVTQCPIPPGSSYTYTWQATQYGSSWYHSHFSLQAWDGIYGGIIVHGPASADYDEDLGNMLLSDWSETTVDSQYVETLVEFGPPSLDNGLLNGTNSFTSSDGKTVGKRLQVNFQKKKRYRLRLVNAAVHSAFRFSIDKHVLKVISSDFTPIVPYTAKSIVINMGQRYDIIVEANQPINNYWIRAYPVTGCSPNSNPNNIKAILRYNRTSTSNPTTQEWPNLDHDACIDEPTNLLTPWLKLDASPNLSIVNQTVGFQKYANADTLWTIDAKPFNNTWANPMLLRLAHNPSCLNTVNNVLYINSTTQWTVLVFNNAAALPHPMHLHGHDFWLLGSGSGSFNGDPSQFHLQSPPRRDTVIMPYPGWVAFAFPPDNPGIWLVHCHIGFHATSGLAMQIVERQGEILKNVDRGQLEGTCGDWGKFMRGDPYGEQDQDGEGPFDDGV